MMLSAPLHKILALPSGPWTRADMRFRVELNGIVANTKYRLPSTSTPSVDYEP